MLVPNLFGEMKRRRRLALLLIAPLLAALAACQARPSSDAEGRLYGEVFADIVHYHMDQTSPDRLALSVLDALGTIDPRLEITEGAGAVRLISPHGEDSFTAPPPNDSAAWGALTGRVVAAARLASSQFARLTQDQTDERLLDAALRRLDRFSRYVGPKLAHQHRAIRDGFVGIGVTLDIAPPLVTIEAVLPNTSAAASGLRTGDHILAIDGTSLATLSKAEIRALLRGPPESHITIEVARAGAPAPANLALRRTFIVEPSVALGETGSIAVLKVREFNRRTAASAAALLGEAHRHMGGRLRGIVLDLRGNPGGLLKQSIALAGLFLANGLVSETAGRAPGSRSRFIATHKRPVEQLPLVVLINGGSASAAEIVAAALQDSGRAVVIGTSSFGKGTVQTVFRTKNGGELTVTWAELLAPRGYRLDHHGVVPTLCTSDASGGQLAPTRLATPRAVLDDAGWQRLRSRCPPRRERSVVDLRIAERLIGTPALYRADLLGGPEDEAEARLP